VTVAFPGLAGVLPGFGYQASNDWGLGFELRDHKDPHWTGKQSSPRTFGHFGQSGTFLWVDPAAGVASVALTDRAFGQWAIDTWPAFTDAVLAEVA
jgi:CubicO group peptidase (beta-lactamase class C family)